MARPRLDLPALAAVLLLAACATPPPPAAPPPVEAVPAAAPPPLEVLARSDEYIVVLPRPGDDFASLAKRYLGDAGRAWWIAEFNGLSRPKAGVDLVIPLKPSLLNSVDAKGVVRTLAVLCYHRFDDGQSKLSVSARDFAEQMDYLAANGYNIVALKDLPAILRGELPMPPKAVAITIDDGYRSTYEIAYPVLLKHRFPATVFLYTDFAGLPAGLTWAQMNEMAASGLIDIQPHSKTHANLTLRQGDEADRAYVERLRQEIDAPSAEIERRIGRQVYAFAYPYGDANETVNELVRRRGISVAFTVNPGGNPFYAYPLMLRRTMIFGDDGLAGFRKKLAVFTSSGER
jgi:peptidoglycan/xylan/chitin deacetylase (PgdA/CDA1 family)